MQIDDIRSNSGEAAMKEAGSHAFFDNKQSCRRAEDPDTGIYGSLHYFVYSKKRRILRTWNSNQKVGIGRMCRL